jgi:hypothetical protein
LQNEKECQSCAGKLVAVLASPVMILNFAPGKHHHVKTEHNPMIPPTTEMLDTFLS